MERAADGFQHSIEILQVEMERLANENKKLQAENKQLREEKQTLASRLSCLSKTTQQAQADAKTEKSFKDSLIMSGKSRCLEDVLQAVTLERDDLRQKLELQKEESERVMTELEELESGNEETMTELRELRSERDALVKQKREREKRLDSMAEDSSSIISSLLVSNTDLVERMERKSEEEENRKQNKVRSFNSLKIAFQKMRRLVVDRKRRKGEQS